jgi:hypothetical protein
MLEDASSLDNRLAQEPISVSLRTQIHRSKILEESLGLSHFA